MATLSNVCVRVPTNRYSKEDILKVADSWLPSNSDAQSLFKRFISSSTIENRYFAIPIEEILSLNGSEHRSRVFKEVGTSLGSLAVNDALSQASIRAADISTLIFTSCSCPVIPSIDASILGKLGFSSTITRLPIYQHGCAGGAIGLALANKLLAKNETALVLSVELCSLVFQPDDLTNGSILGSALFGDGAACAIVSADTEGLEILDTQSFLIPDSTGIMGYDIRDDGTHLRLDRALPSILADFAPTQIQQFLSTNGLAIKDVKWWLFHPGGIKILGLLEETFGLSRSQTRWSWNTLAEHGNLSSASILFVLSQFMKDRTYVQGDNILVLGVGPGLTLELLLLRCSK